MRAGIVHVTDGDTVVVHSLDGRDLGRVRVLGAKAPETGRPGCHAEEATATRAELLEDQPVTLTVE